VPAIAIAAGKLFTSKKDRKSQEQGSQDTSSEDEGLNDAAKQSQNDGDAANENQDSVHASGETMDHGQSDALGLASGLEEAGEDGVVRTADAESESKGKDCDESAQSGLNAEADVSGEKSDGEDLEKQDESGQSEVKDGAELKVEEADHTRKDFVVTMLQVLQENKGKLHELEARIVELQGTLAESGNAMEGVQETLSNTAAVMEELVVKLAEAKTWREGEDARTVQQVAEALVQQLQVCGCMVLLYAQTDVCVCVCVCRKCVYV
jgi:hypothetical protein